MHMTPTSHLKPSMVVHACRLNSCWKNVCDEAQAVDHNQAGAAGATAVTAAKLRASVAGAAGASDLVVGSPIAVVNVLLRYK